MKIKVYVDSKIKIKVLPLIDRKRAEIVKNQKEANICIILPRLRYSVSLNKKVVVLYDTINTARIPHHFISFLKCPYTLAPLAVLTNSILLPKILISTIHIEKTSKKHINFMITYWHKATSFIESLANLQKSLFQSVGQTYQFKKQQRNINECIKSRESF